MDFNALVTQLVDHPAAAIAAMAILANVYQYKEARTDQRAALDLALKIAPLADQLSKAIDTAERIITHKSQP